MRRTRRGTWLSGLILALVGAVWMAVQMVLGVITLVGGIVHAGDPLPAATEIWDDSGGR
ncbi:MAG: hypothetical protein QG671_4142 [Actinomycetota bacterium]|nr:hypothetical protein [Actinomycetota bacterium]